MLAKEVPNNTSENQIPSLRSQLSNHVQSVASPQYKHQLKCAWRRSSLISAFLWMYIQPRSSTICCLKRHTNQDQSTYILKNFTYMGMGQYLLIPFLVGWTSIYQLFWGSIGTRVLTHPHMFHIRVVSTESTPKKTHGLFKKLEVQDPHFNPVHHLRSIVKLK